MLKFAFRKSILSSHVWGSFVGSHYLLYLEFLLLSGLIFNLNNTYFGYFRFLCQKCWQPLIYKVFQNSMAIILSTRCVPSEKQDISDVVHGRARCQGFTPYNLLRPE
uniref:Uncharacterized protein n=1 Tax=Cacopsylla melanoneura TaxID=428564 RepID=A0A8D9ACP2_9HEMI